MRQFEKRRKDQMEVRGVHRMRQAHDQHQRRKNLLKRKRKVQEKTGNQKVEGYHHELEQRDAGGVHQGKKMMAEQLEVLRQEWVLGFDH